MAHKDFNAVIGQIEEDLKKLQSAKEQVEKVVTDNTEFAKATSDLAKNTQSLVAEIKTATEGALGQFAEKLTVSENAVNNVVTESISRIESNIKKTEDANQKLQEITQAKVNEVSDIAKKQAETIVSQSLATISDTSKLVKTTLEEQKAGNIKTLNQCSEQLTETKNNLQILFKQTKNNIEQITQAFQENATSKITELSNLATNSIEEQKTKNLKTLNAILETHNHIKQLIGQLLDLKIPETLKSINENIEKANKNIADFRKEFANIETNNQSRFKKVKSLQISALTIVGVFGIVIVLKLFGVI